MWSELKTQKDEGNIKELYLSTLGDTIASEDVDRLSVISFSPIKVPGQVLTESWDNLTREQKNRLKNWVFLNKKKGELRGLLSIKVVTNNDVTIHILEIQRKIIGTKEESFRGLAFTLQNEKDFQDELKSLMKIMSYNCGVISNEAIKKIKGYAYRYNHAKPRKGEEEGKKIKRSYKTVVSRVLKRLDVEGV